MERKIGEIFICKGKTYKVVKDSMCRNCSFTYPTCDYLKNILGNCCIAARTDVTSVIFKEINNMEIKNSQITIDIPEGMEIDIENSDFTKGVIKFKSKYITYDDIEKTLHLKETCIGITTDVNNIDRLCAINELMNIAKYYNKDWKPNWDGEEFKHFIVLNHCSNTYKVDYDQNYSGDTIYFKNREDVQSVIDNPNFKEILDTIYKNK